MMPLMARVGYRAASATPIWALWAATWRSALRTSGRRRRRSAGMPVATQAGVLGIGLLPSSGPGPRSGSRSRGGMPSSVQSVSLA